jgi:DNA-binding transcriptional regulator YhcF (GntR family)
MVSRTTVTGAYDRLAGEGFVTARVDAGTVVSEHLGAGRHKLARQTLQELALVAVLCHSYLATEVAATPPNGKMPDVHVLG